MYLVETTSNDFIHPRLDRLSSKRKLDDYGPTDESDLVSVRMRKDEPIAASVNSISTNLITPSHHNQHQHDQQQSQIESKHGISDAGWDSSCSSHTHLQPIRAPSKLQFFVRAMSSGSKTLVLKANYEDTVESIHERIRELTGIPVSEQRLIYEGKQLEREKSLAECSIQNDAGLQLVGRMRSTLYPKAWQVVDEMVSLIFRLCKGEYCTLSSNDVFKRVRQFMAEITGDKLTVEAAATGNLQVFSSSGVPAALVILYVSPYKGNKQFANELIRNFIKWSLNVLPKCFHFLCAPIIFEFCKLMGRACHDDPLYSFCRSSLGSMMECVRIEKESKDNIGSSKASILFQDIFEFVRELAGSLSDDLAASMTSSSTSTRSSLSDVASLSKDLSASMTSSPTSTGPSLSDVSDFTAFLAPLRTAIVEQLGVSGSISMPMRESDHKLSSYADEIKALHHIFTDLAGKMEQCLRKLEDLLAVKDKREGEDRCLGCCHYLLILKALNNISKLYCGTQDQFGRILRRRKVSLCHLIVRYANRSDDHRWLLKHKGVTDFECRRHFALMMLPEAKEDYEELHEMLIDRSQILAESFEYFSHADPEALRGGLFMEFKNEEATGPGVLREWFFLVCQAIFNPQNALFLACPNDRRRFFPNPASKVDPLHLKYFKFSGRVIALAFMHKVQIGIVFDRVFFLQLAGKNVSLEDIHDADPCLYSSCKQILEMDAEMVDSDALGLTFVREVEELGSRRIVELCPGGKNLVVNSENREMYVKSLIEHRFVTSISEQVAWFAQGFSDILCDSWLQKYFFQSLELEDLDWMLHGSDNAISVAEWKAHTEYKGYKENDPQILWFWKIVREMSADQRKVLLFFWTSVKYLPVEGFGGLASRLYIYKSAESYNRLPSSHTCFYQLCFAPYPSMAIMEDRLRVITQEHVASSFGTW